MPHVRTLQRSHDWHRRRLRARADLLRRFEVRLPIEQLLAFERSGVLRWVHPYNVSLEPGGQRPHVGAVLFFCAPSGQTYTCQVAAYVGDEVDVAYTGPKRPREHMLELIELVRVKGA
jgi:hypothetical protein